LAYNSRVIPERWQRIEDLYHSALEQKQADRASFLADACQGDAELKHEVEVLLANEQRARSFLESEVLEFHKEFRHGCIKK
jgi:eukaryotic-like serine/threonine-protein kinase